jgi:hypothetical protein
MFHATDFSVNVIVPATHAAGEELRPDAEASLLHDAIRIYDEQLFKFTH